MKINEISIYGLHNRFDYKNIRFNDDVSFLFGLNGSGKTTILNILEATISGNIQKLFEYDFRNIELIYTSPRGTRSKIEINVNQEVSGSKMKIFNLLFDGQGCKIAQISEDVFFDREHEFHRSSIRSKKMLEINDFYFNNYPILKRIKKSFEYVYLPLNRISANETIFEDERFLYHNKNRTKFEKSERTSNFDSSMREVENLISSTYRDISFKTKYIDEKFRNDVLSSLTNIQPIYEIDSTLESFYENLNLKNNIWNVQNKYTDVMRNLSLLTEKKEEEIDNFFSSISHVKSNDNDLRQVFRLYLQLNEVYRLDAIVNLADETEKIKRKLNKPIKLFHETVNKFINDEMDEKKIHIENGKVYFRTRHSQSKIPINYLSSGEKQILSFFANLIFKIDSSLSGIYIVDEPELSLHLNWQRQFIDSALSINKNIQFIFATHAPEIIGHRRDKLVKLDKRFSEGR